jgi:hypothetical protein
MNLEVFAGPLVKVAEPVAARVLIGQLLELDGFDGDDANPREDRATLASDRLDAVLVGCFWDDRCPARAVEDVGEMTLVQDDRSALRP